MRMWRGTTSETDHVRINLIKTLKNAQTLGDCNSLISELTKGLTPEEKGNLT